MRGRKFQTGIRTIYSCNHEKFQSMSLGSKHKNKQMKIDVMNNDIESHSEMKLLGVTIDEHLNFSRHIGEVC